MCFSRAHHIPILTGLWAMSSALSILVRYTKIWVFASISMCHSRTHDSVFTTIHWTMIIAIAIFHWDTEISSQLFGPVLIPFSRAHHFPLLIITSYWLKFLGLNCNSQSKK